MHILVIGAGIVGVSTALALARAGHSVCVIDQSNDVAMGASFANAGLISPGHSFSWAEPGVFSMLARSVFGKVDGFGIGKPWDPRLWPWGLRFIRQSNLARWRANSRAAIRLSAYSRDLLAGDSIVPLAAYGGTAAGILYLSPAGSPASASELELLREAGEPFEVVAGNDLRQLEPGFGDAAASMFGSAVFCPRDATGDARRYAACASDHARAMGVTFQLQTKVLQLLTHADRIRGVVTDTGTVNADAIVVCAGAASRLLLRPLGYRLPIQAVSGYSLTFRAPSLTRLTRGGVSIQHKIAWASFGDNEIRFTGFADVGTPADAVITDRFAALQRFAVRLVPAVASVVPERWIGQRPMTPDGIPVLGASAHGGLYLNCGHGAMGWTMARGCAQLLVDEVSARPLGIDISSYRFSRF